MNPHDQCPFWKLNMFLLKFYGLWPDQPLVFRRSLYIFFVTYVLSCFIPMVQGFIEEKELDIIISFESIVGITTICGGVGQCSSLYFRVAYIHKLYDQIKFDYQSTTDPVEREILKHHSRRGKLLGLIFLGSFTGGYMWYCSLTYLPLLFKKGVPPQYLRSVPYYSNRWVINSKFRDLQALLHGNLGIFYAELAYMAAISMYICCVHHVCGMFAIVGFRLKKLVKENEILLPKKIKENDQILAELLDIIDMHKEAIKTVNLIRSTFSRNFFSIELGALLCLAMLIFDCNYNMGRSWLLTSRIFFIMAMFAELLLYLNYGGQQIIDYSNGILISTYYMQWYLLSPDARRTLLMIIRRGLKGDILSAGIMTLSLENFTTIIKMSWSLACVLLSSQKK